MNLKQVFNEVFNSEVSNEYFSPGRINLIGEHIDYSGGVVLPCAISIGTTVLTSVRPDLKLKFYSHNMPDIGIIEIDLNDLEFKEVDNWTNYPKGIFKLLKDQGYNFDHGLNILFSGNIPYGSGLSSSASILMATAFLVNDIYNLNIELIDLVKLTRKVENEYIGVSTGIMDQFAIGFGKYAHAILLNTNSLDYTYLPLDLKDNDIVIMNTNKKRGLADSAYNERKASCDRALEILQEVYPVEYLCDLSLDQLMDQKDRLQEGDLFDRAYHAIDENERTKKAASALQNGDLELFGHYLNASHDSLRDKYEVTGFELDTLQERAISIDGCLGARVTGAGFGGCAIAIVKRDQVEHFIEDVSQHYLEKVGYAADFYVAQTGNGTHRVN